MLYSYLTPENKGVSQKAGTLTLQQAQAVLSISLGQNLLSFIYMFSKTLRVNLNHTHIKCVFLIKIPEDKLLDNQCFYVKKWQFTSECSKSIFERDLIFN